jgi:hypothetical protein
MPMHRSQRTRWLSHVLVTAIFLGIGSLPPLALCIGPSGHRAIEPVSTLCCHQAPSSSAAESAHVPTGRCAEECTDTPLGIGPALTAAGGTNRATPAMPLALAPVITDAAVGLAGGRIQPAPAFPAERSPRQVRTRVNLC